VRAEHVNYGEQANTQEDIDDSNWDRKPADLLTHTLRLTN